MWILSFLPDSFLIWVVNTILVLGLAGTLSSYFIRFIPPLMPYAGLIKTVGIVLLVAGVWFRGGYDNEMSWRARAADMEAKIAVSEEKSKDANKKLSDALKDKTQAVKDATAAVQLKIKQDAAKIDAKCVVDPIVILDLNEAAKSPKGKVTVQGVSK
ncbi:hypothetical protein UFOVP181_260 [uncultured Caudovirales phage]|uniref:Uncharacterized protein n=1 Tax=uncultured Caudovirales phage TaxID=2100421 RepID=A0A6J7WHA8_9CAUD|nr:hypothetical protein UFOVP57_379 [uncultured Caudovirales phage]CAB5208948.1 hypothetical protein UFOVP181_260 [uncultured Caudovirales phage]